MLRAPRRRGYALFVRGLDGVGILLLVEEGRGYTRFPCLPLRQACNRTSNKALAEYRDIRHQ